MNITLPKKKNTAEQITLKDPRNIIIIGANGAGKSRFGKELERQCLSNAFRISAFKALSIQPRKAVRDKLSSVSALYEEQLDKEDKIVREEKGQDQIYVSEFDKLIYLLQTEEFKSLVRFKEIHKNDSAAQYAKTKLDRTQIIWESIFTHSKIHREGDKLLIMGVDSDHWYNASRMSQGEKVVFYLIAATLFAPENAVLIVEDPEMYLHRSITSSLWDSIEQNRPDCTFIYLTHDIEFAATREEGIRIWVKSYDADNRSFDYEFIQNQDAFPEEIYLELLGSRKPVLFIEGTDNSSIDIKLYPYIFPEYTVKPLGGCTKVIETTKAFSEMKLFHHLESKGIVDRDRRTEKEISYLRERNIFVPNVAEVENLLMLEEVVRTVARRMLQDEATVFKTVKHNVIELFKADIDAQALLHTRHRIRRQLEYMIDKRLTSIDEFAQHIETLTDTIDSRKLYEGIRLKFKEYAASANYAEILRVYNQKGMLPQSRVAQLCALTNKEAYLNYVLSVLKENKSDARIIRTAIQHCFGLDKSYENE